MEGRYDRPAVAHSARNAWSTGIAAVALFCIMVALLTGCQDQTSLIPNSDPALRKTKAEFAKDAVARHPYHADAPRAKADGAASVDYGNDTLQIANFSPETWKNVEVWVNGKWVVFLPSLPGNTTVAKTIDFSMMYDAMGRPFPSENASRSAQIQKVEIYRDGTMYELKSVDVN